MSRQVCSPSGFDLGNAERASVVLTQCSPVQIEEEPEEEPEDEPADEDADDKDDDKEEVVDDVEDEVRLDSNAALHDSF